MSARTAQPSITHGEADRRKGHDRVIYPDTLSPALTPVPYGPGSPDVRLPVTPDPVPADGHHSRTIFTGLTALIRPTGVQLWTPAALTPSPTRWEYSRA